MTLFFINMAHEKLLNELYYNIKSGYMNAEKLYNKAHSIDHSITRQQVNNWLEKQRAYTLHKSAWRRYPRNKISVRAIDEEWQMDLVDLTSLSKYNNGYKFLLNCIDLFSKFAWSIPIKNKNSKSILDAVKLIFSSSKRVPLKIQTDKGV